MNAFFILQRLRTFGAIFLLLLFTLSVSGCTTLKPLSSYSETCIKVLSDRMIFEDYVNIVERQKTYVPEDLQAKLDVEKNRRQKQSKSFRTIQKTLIKYMTVIKILASDTIITRNNLDALMDKFTDAEYSDGTLLFDEQDVLAVGSITNLLLRASTDQYRKSEIKTLIRSANPELQTLTASLFHFCTSYIESLETEKSYITNYYETVIKIAESNPPQQAAIVLVREIKNEKVRAIEIKIMHAKKYQCILQSISDCHNFITNNLNSLTSEQILATIQKHEIEISSLYESINKGVDF